MICKRANRQVTFVSLFYQELDNRLVAVLRIVPNLATQDVAASRAFYADLFGLDVVMDMGWIATLATGRSGPTQLSVASEGGSGTPVPVLSIEVDDLEATYARAAQMGAPISYPLTVESWGVRRFFVTDPAGHTLNILCHAGDAT